MRKTVLIGAVVVAVLATALIANADQQRDRDDKLDPLSSPRKVVNEHIDALNNCDVDRLMAQYPPKIHIVLPGGVTVEGRDDVRDLFEGSACRSPMAWPG
jgi:hypothetical protein